MWTTTLATIVLVAAAAAVAHAQTAAPLQNGLALYAAASYDEALVALDEARQMDLPLDDRVVLEQHRMLCLLALDRTAAAEEAATALVERKPDFVLSADDASPRVRAAFARARGRVLPSVLRRSYGEAKAAYDAGDYTRAQGEFTRLTTLLADPQLAAADPTLADLRTLADGFLQLSATAAAAASRQRDVETLAAVTAALPPIASPWPEAAVAPAAMSVPALEVSRLVDDTEVAVPAAAPTSATADLVAATADPTPPVAPPSTPVPPPFAPMDIFTYDWRDKDVVAPVAVSQALTGWWGSMGEPPRGTPLGAIDIVIDERGQVVDARIYHSVNRVYDTVLLQSVKQWQFRPATRDGRPVKYRRITSVASAR